MGKLTKVSGSTIYHMILTTDPGCAKKVSIIFILETYTHSVAKKYKVSQPREILHLREGGLSGFAEEESIDVMD